MASKNQTPEQKARDNIDSMLEDAGWKVQPKKKIDFNAGPGIAVREYDTDVGPADYVLFSESGVRVKTHSASASQGMHWLIFTSRLFFKIFTLTPDSLLFYVLAFCSPFVS